jgi:CubicO group peptidase (beta-lactamase class C family)
LTKPYTATICMALAERGLLDLDRPASLYIDPWLSAQIPPQPTLKQIWQGNSMIDTVTARQMLGMRSGAVLVFELDFQHTCDPIQQHASRVPTFTVHHAPTTLRRHSRLQRW